MKQYVLIRNILLPFSFLLLISGDAFAKNSKPSMTEMGSLTVHDPIAQTLGKSHKKVIKGTNGFEILVDYDKMTIAVDGQEIPIIVDGDVSSVNHTETTWVHLPYNRFDVYVEQNYYNNNTPAIDDFFNKFEPRFALLETITGWSSEKFYGTKLIINVVSTAGGCYGGVAYPGNPVIYFSDPLYKTGCSEPGGIGELGDNWPYMYNAIHEALHSINPLPIYDRLWLTEGWSEYYGYNLLSNYGDISQTTADSNIFNGIGHGGYRWNAYIANDYHDGYNNPIQESAGYDITAWMYSMLRDNYSLNWNNFYSILNNNLETMDKARDFYPDLVYNIDMHIIDVFGRALGHTNFENQTKPIFRYNGPSGPGWGVRNWTDLNWYADLTPNLTVSDTIPPTGDSIQLNATVHNTGAVNLNGVVVRFYSDTTLIKEKVVSIPESSFTLVSTKYTAPVGIYTVKVVANEGHIKIEKDYNNNTDSVKVIFLMLGDANEDGKRTISDAVYLVNYLFKGGPAPVPVLRSGDCNCDGKVTVADVVYLINYLFKGGPLPAC